jgi:hypothetical protein
MQHICKNTCRLSSPLSIFCIDNARVIYKKITATSRHVFTNNSCSSVSNGLYFLTLPLVSVMRVIHTSKELSKTLECALYIRCALSIEKYGNWTLFSDLS